MIRSWSCQLADIDKIKIIDNRKLKEDMRAVWSRHSPDFLIDGPFFSWSTFNAAVHMKIHGKVIFTPSPFYQAMGFAWNDGEPPAWCMLPCDKDNYFTNTVAVDNGKKQSKMYYGADAGGTPEKPKLTSRPAYGMKDTRFMGYATTAGVSMEWMRDILYQSGWTNVVIGDGGGSTMEKDKAGEIYSPRIIPYFIGVWVKKAEPVVTPNDLKRAKVLSAAAAEIGVVESPAGSNRTKYGKWYGLDGYAWCMMWTQWVFSMAGLPLPLRTASCTEFANYAKAHGQWVTKDYKSGDVLLMHWGKNAKAMEHVGIIESVQSTYVVTIEGNTSLTSQDNGGKVMRRNRAYANITGAYRPWYNM